MEQVRRISGAVAPDYTFLVIDAMTGQDAVDTAGRLPTHPRHRRRDPLQARRRRPRRRRAQRQGGDRQADRLRLDGGEARRLRAVPPRPHGRAHPRHGRRADADRARRAGVREGPGRGRRVEADGGSVHPRRLPRADAAAEEDGPARRAARDDAGHAQGAQGRPDRRRRPQAGRGDHPLDDARGAGDAPDHQRLAAHPHRPRLGHVAERREPPGQAVQRDAEDDEALRHGRQVGKGKKGKGRARSVPWPGARWRPPRPGRADGRAATCRASLAAFPVPADNL